MPLPVSGLSVVPVIVPVMKSQPKIGGSTRTKPEKVLLHMARKDGDWAGLAIRFDGEDPHKFQSLKDLFTWLSGLRTKK